MISRGRVLASAAIAALAVLGGAAHAETFGTGASQFTIDFVPISGSTNPTSGYGIVNHDYRMGVYEITNDQWNKFKTSLGVPVKGNPESAYNEDPYHTGTNVPTNMVSWNEAAQFVNWLNTSKGHQAAYKFTGTQGTSDYTLATWNAAEAWGGTNLYRHKDAFYFLPTEDEWVKAAYWNGTTLQDYANESASDLVGGVPDQAKWNYSPSLGEAPWVVGSGSKELNGTYDMMGNLQEWMESPYSDTNYDASSSRGMRGGQFAQSSASLASSSRLYYLSESENSDIGFRVASISSVPEPSSVAALLGLAVMSLLWWRRRR